MKKSGYVIDAGYCYATSQLLAQGRIERISFLKERSRNLFENKGALWKTSEATGNVYENKGA
jgi:hypothetical protein